MSYKFSLFLGLTIAWLVCYSIYALLFWHQTIILSSPGVLEIITAPHPMEVALVSAFFVISVGIDLPPVSWSSRCNLFRVINRAEIAQ